MEHLMAQNDSELLAQGDQLLRQAKQISLSLACPSIDDVEMPQVILERGQDWSLEGAVNLQLRKVQRRPDVSVTLLPSYIEEINTS